MKFSYIFRPNHEQDGGGYATIGLLAGTEPVVMRLRSSALTNCEAEIFGISLVWA